MKRILSAILVAGLFVSLPAFAIDIIDLHQNDASGVPTMLGQTVTVTGVVTVPKMVFSDYSLEIYIQDATAGMNIYVSSAIGDYEAALGDSLTVTAPVAHYQGLTELGTASADVTIVNHGPASVIPDPMVITCAEMNASYLADNTEPNESRLIRINGVTIDSGTWPTVPGSSNSFIDITDGTGIGLLFIDKDCEVNGSPAPSGSFDVIGILKQYDSSSPYTDGYEILPRYIGDVVVDIPGPPILGFPLVRNVTQTSVDILFETLDPGSSEVEYGLDDSYGNTAGDAGASETDHLVPLSGLTPGTLYHFRVKSTDASGTNYSDDRVLVTASANPGQIHIAMSNSADHSYAEGENVADNQNISQIVSDLIGMATVSVDAAMYSFSTDNVRDALIDAHQRGCQVRIIIDANNSSSHADQCAAYGIPYIRSTFAGNHGADENYGYMHNKFIVIDGFDVDTGNNWVWAGSANLSYSGDGDTNNTFRIQDYGLSQAYTLEFDEMWGNHGPGPNPWYSKMGSNKIDNTPHEFMINGIRIEQYMSPTDQVRYHIQQTIASADHSIYFCIYAFTDYHITDAMKDRRYDIPELEIRGVFDEGQNCATGSQYYDMIGDPCADPYAWDTPADVWLDTFLPSSNLLHHKYLVVDANWENSDPMVLAGSHNWSFSAETKNDENTVIFHDVGISNLYLQEFADRYHESGGTGPLGEVDVGVEEHDDVSGRLLSQVNGYPNPFNPFTNITFTTKKMAPIDVRVFDATGRLVRTLAEDQNMEAGYHILAWDGKNDAGQAQPSGVYFARVSGQVPGDGTLENGQVKLVLVQ